MVRTVIYTRDYWRVVRVEQFNPTASRWYIVETANYNWQWNIAEPGVRFSTRKAAMAYLANWAIA